MLAADVVGGGIREFMNNVDGPAFLERELVGLGVILQSVVYKVHFLLLYSYLRFKNLKWINRRKRVGNGSKASVG